MMRWLIVLLLVGCASTPPAPHAEVGGGFARAEDGRVIWWDEQPAAQPGKP